MRILLASTSSFPEGGLGVARAVFMQAKGLAQAGHVVTVGVCHTTLTSSPAEMDGFTVRSFSGEQGRAIKLVSSMAWLRGQVGILSYLLVSVFTRRFDTVVFCGAAPVFAITALAARLAGCHTCYVQGDLLRLTHKPLAARADLALSRTVSLIVVGGSALLEKHFREVAPKTKCARLWPPTDVEYFGSGDAARARAELDLDGLPLVVYAGAVSRLEGIDVLLHAMKEVVRRYPETALVVAGPILEHDMIGGAPVDYRLLAQTLSIASAVRFAGTLQMSQIADLFAAASVLVNPKVDHLANRAAAPIKIGEYLAAKRPVVTTRVCGLDEWLVDRTHVLFCNPADSHQLAERICEVLAEASLAQRLAREGAAVARRVCDYRAWAAGVAGAIEATNKSFSKVS